LELVVLMRWKNSARCTASANFGNSGAVGGIVEVV
jgi:hypothetical protein